MVRSYSISDKVIMAETLSPTFVGFTFQVQGGGGGGDAMDDDTGGGGDLLPAPQSQPGGARGEEVRGWGYLHQPPRYEDLR